MHTKIEEEQSPSRYTDADIRRMKGAMLLSLCAGFFMLMIKIYAYVITGSAAILSDAAESIVHVLAVSFAAYSLRLSLKPADATHKYGHDRISFFSSGFEGGMIVLAAIYIIYEAIHKWLMGLSLENIGSGAIFTTIATVINGGLGWYLVHQGKRYHSIVLEANGKHVLTDSWTSLGVILALILTLFTGWLPFDPILAIIVALNILWTGGNLIRRSIGGLMDESDPKVDAVLNALMQRETSSRGISFHHLRHRNAGNKLLVEFHLLFHENVPLATAHEQATQIEKEIHRAFPSNVEVISHLEPVEGHDEIHNNLL
ncbi:MAG TPA: cation diffusion facilitator family transporter [Bacteroidota bacterium]|jgi:cation diffusion facilitator family transporter|nr:cation diffusion facilitator family transporter [Bacteroidota bacterium]